jgi:hypothetical protein
MVIREETPDRLVIDDRPVLIAVLLGLGLLVVAGVTMALMSAGQWGGAAMLGLGTVLVGAAIALFVRRTMLFLDRPSGTVLIRSTTVFGTNEQRHALSALRGAQVQTSRSGKGGPAHRPALLLSGGQAVPITPIYTSGRGAGRAVEAIERWLATGGAAPRERA